MRNIVLDTQSGLFAKALQRILMQELDGCQVIISERPDLTVQRCKTFKPYALLMEATSYTPWALGERLSIRDEVVKHVPNCKVVILVDDTADKKLAEAVKQAKKDARIDTFLFDSTSESYLVAVMDSL